MTCSSLHQASRTRARSCVRGSLARTLVLLAWMLGMREAATVGQRLCRMLCLPCRTARARLFLGRVGAGSVGRAAQGQ